MLCCGHSDKGQLGLGASEKEVYTNPVLNTFIPGQCKQVASSINHTLFLLDDGSVCSCGSNDFGQLGHSKTKTKPQLVDALRMVECVQVGCGLCFSVCLSVDGRLFVFGSLSGQVDLMHYRKPNLLNEIEGRVLHFGVGHHHLVALSESGLLYAMGGNQFGQLGVGKRLNRCERPIALSFHGVPIAHVACGAFHTVMVSKSGYVFSFGSNQFGQLGIGIENRGQSVTSVDDPTQIVQLNGQNVAGGLIKNIIRREVRRVFALIVTAQGGVFSFGSGTYGQLGHGSTNHEALPRKIFELMGSIVTQVACGRCHTLAYTPLTGRVYAFGNCSSGQLGMECMKRTPRPLVSITSPTAIPLKFLPFGNVTNGETNGYVLTSIFAGGDQTFIRFSTPQMQRLPLDYRFIMDRRCIRTLSVAFARELCSVSGLERKFVSSEIIRAIEISFKFSTCLNGSFLSENVHMDASTRRSGIDLQQVIDFFEKLRSVNEFISGVIASYLGPMLSSQSTNCPIEGLRIYITLPFCHLFERDDYLG
ncbi:hypothetical protein ACOME3_002058 [Neoechinorhynchus agilis]